MHSTAIQKWCVGSRVPVATQGSQHILHVPIASGSAWPETMRGKSKMSMKGLFFRVDLSKPLGPRSGLEGCPRVSQLLQC